MKKNNKKELSFDMKHTEAMFWEFLVNDVTNIVNNLETLLQESKLMFKTTIDKTEYAGLSFPSTGPVRALSIVKNSGDGFKLTDVVPILKGANFAIDNNEKYTWKNVALGEFDADLKDRWIQFFDPLFALDSQSKEKTPTVSLSAVALNLKQFKERSFVIDKGYFYQEKLQEFLKDNPNKTEKDFEAPKLNLTKKTFRMIMPSNFSSQMEIVASIEDINHTSFLGIPIHILTINLEHTVDNSFLNIPLYVTDNVLEGYTPKIGDTIECVAWFCGYFN